MKKVLIVLRATALLTPFATAQDLFDIVQTGTPAEVWTALTGAVDMMTPLMLAAEYSQDQDVIPSSCGRGRKSTIKMTKVGRR